MNYFAFDIETHKVTPEGEDWQKHRPLGISSIAASVYSDEGGHAQLLWYNAPGAELGVMVQKDEHGLIFPEPVSSAAMTSQQVGLFLTYLYSIMNDAVIAGWNSAGFDFQVLAEESGRYDLASEVCANHVDMMFHFACITGYRLGLDTAAKGMGVPGKTEGMKGALAPVLWQGSIEDRKKVLTYVLQDTKATLDVLMEVQREKRLQWVSKKGYPMKVTIPEWLTVAEAVKLPAPNMTWGTPIERQDYIGWMKS